MCLLAQNVNAFYINAQIPGSTSAMRPRPEPERGSDSPTTPAGAGGPTGGSLPHNITAQVPPS